MFRYLFSCAFGSQGALVNQPRRCVMLAGSQCVRHSQAPSTRCTCTCIYMHMCIYACGVRHSQAPSTRCTCGSVYAYTYTYTYTHQPRRQGAPAVGTSGERSSTSTYTHTYTYIHMHIHRHTCGRDQGPAGSEAVPAPAAIGDEGLTWLGHMAASHGG